MNLLMSCWLRFVPIQRDRPRRRALIFLLISVMLNKRKELKKRKWVERLYKNLLSFSLLFLLLFPAFRP